jgi:AcrR family transcriptional regulator
MPRTSTERKELLAEERSNQILDAAARLFATQGFHQTTTKQIAAEAGVAEGTIYNYFSSKHDLLIGMLSRLAEMDVLSQAMAHPPTGDQHAFVTEMLRQRLAIIDRNLDIIRAVMPQMLADPELGEQLLKRFAGPALLALRHYTEAQVAAGNFRPVNPALHARLVPALLIGFMLMEIAGDETLKGLHDQIPQAVAELLLDGLLVRLVPTTND